MSPRLGAAVVALLVATAAGCGSVTSPSPGPAASPSPTPEASPSSPTPTLPPSPVVGVIVAVDAASLSNVRGFSLRLADGATIAFTLGALENPTEFPPGHLKEHEATSSPIRVFFRLEGGSPVVYRIEDASG